MKKSITKHQHKHRWRWFFGLYAVSLAVMALVSFLLHMVVIWLQ